MPVPSSPYLLQTPWITIRWYGFLIGIGILMALYVGLKLIKRAGLDEETMLDAVLWAIPSGILGARLYYVLFHWDYYGTRLSEAVRIWEGGLAIHGGLFAGVLVAYLYFKKRKVDFWPYLDLAMPALALAQAIGRWGNWFNQEAYGSVTTLPWGMLIQGQLVHPTFLYESIWDLLLFVFLFRGLWSFKKPTGWATALYTIWYSVGRFFIEGIRTDSEWIGPFRAAQVFSLVLILLGLYIYYRKVKNVSTEQQRGVDES